jgi:hypothetical protein
MLLQAAVAALLEIELGKQATYVLHGFTGTAMPAPYFHKALMPGS